MEQIERFIKENSKLICVMLVVVSFYFIVNFLNFYSHENNCKKLYYIPKSIQSECDLVVFQNALKELNKITPLKEYNRNNLNKILVGKMVQKKILSMNESEELLNFLITDK